MHKKAESQRRLPVHRRVLAPGGFLLAALLAAALSGAFGLALATARVGHDGLGRGVIPAAAGIVQTAPSGSSADNTFTITVRGGTTETVDVSASTTYLERGAPSASGSSIAAGDLVAVFGTTSGSTVTATQVVIAVPRSIGGAQNPAAAGVVQSTPPPGPDSFTIQTRGGTTETVDVGSPSTTYVERGVASPSLANVTPGDLVAVFGTTSGSTVTATLVVIWTPIHHGFAVAGIVQGTPGVDSFTIETRGGVMDTVDVNPSTTRYFERGVPNASLSDVANGDRVGVFGTISGSTVTATAVLIAAPPVTPASFATAGTVQTTPASGSFVIETCSHTQVTVDVTGTTTYVERSVASPTLANVAVADDVAVFGTTSGSTVTATQIVIGGNERAQPGHFAGGSGGRGGFGGRGGRGNSHGGFGKRF